MHIFRNLLSAAVAATALVSFTQTAHAQTSAPQRRSPETSSSSANCSLSSPAFCDTFNQGPSAIRGRGGDLDPAKWSASRLVPDIRNDVINYVAAAPIPPCKASLNSTNVYPPDDTLICDGSGRSTPRLLTAVAMQNYGNNSYMIRQPFDFAGRV